MGSSGLEPFQHQVDHGDMHLGFATFRSLLIVSWLNRRRRLNQANIRSTTHRLGNTSKWWRSGLRLTTVSSQPPVAQAQATSRPT